MREFTSDVRPGWLLLVVLVLFALGGIASAEQIGTAKDLETWKKADYRDYMYGKKKVEDKKDAEKVANYTAQYHIYRITHSAPKAEVQLEFAKMIFHGEKKDNKEFLNILGPKMVESMKEVLRAQDPKKDATVIINAAMMLPTMARLKQDDVGAYLVDLVKGKDTHPAVRLYALKALKEYMPISEQPTVEDYRSSSKLQIARRERDKKYVELLTKFIEDPVEVKGMSQGEMKGVKFLRREAIISLAYAGSPAVLAVPEKVGKKKTPDGMVAPTLLKIVAGDLQPPPSMQEKVEAAIGLLNMKYPNMPEYNPDLTTYLVGKMLVDFATEYNTDAINFTGFKSPAYLPWKADARRLKDALSIHARNANTKNAKALRSEADLVLDKIIAYGSPNLNQFSGEVEKWRPEKDSKVFKTLTAPQIHLDPGN